MDSQRDDGKTASVTPAPDKPTVFVLDGDIGAQRGLRSLLQTYGMNVCVYSPAEDFLAAFRPVPRACLLSEADLPGMSGLELVQELKAQGIPLPIIFMATQGNISNAAQALRAGALDYLEKPFLQNVLMSLRDPAGPAVIDVTHSAKLDQNEEAYDLFANQRDGVLKSRLCREVRMDTSTSVCSDA